MGKSAGRCADIDADAAFRTKAKMVERCRELDAAPRYIRMGRSGAQRCIDRNFLGSLAHNPFIGADEPRLNGGLRFGAAFKNTAFDQQAIGALANAYHSLASGTGNNVPRTLVTCTGRQRSKLLLVEEKKYGT